MDMRRVVTAWMVSISLEWSRLVPWRAGEYLATHKVMSAGGMLRCKIARRLVDLRRLVLVLDLVVADGNEQVGMFKKGCRRLGCGTALPTQLKKSLWAN